MRRTGSDTAEDDDGVARAPTVLPGSEFSLSGGAETSQVQTRSLAPSQLSDPLTKRYQLVDQLGSGGMGAVYLAHDGPLHRAIAVKVMHGHVASNPTLVRRFFKEAQISAQLEHPGIVPTYTIDSSESGQPRLAMRLIRGRDLEKTIEASAKKYGTGLAALDRLLDRLELFVRAADAVHFAHQKGVVHRDIKPENIMVGPHRDAYVMDWGLATLHGAPVNEEDEEATSKSPDSLVQVDNDPKATRFGELMGTVAYMAPEQAMGDHALVGPAADQFALGMTLQELVTLTPARSGPNLTAALTKAVMGEREALPAWVPEGLAAIIQRATAPEIAERYVDVKAMAADVRRFLRGEELEVLPDSLPKKLWRFLSAHQSMALSGLLALVLLVATLMIFHVVSQADRREAAARHAQFIAEHVSLVSSRASQIDSRARGVEIELARLGGAARHVLIQPAPEQIDYIRPADLSGPRAPQDVKKSERYGQKVTFEHGVIVTAPNPGADAEADERRLATLEPDIKRAFQSKGLVKGIEGAPTAAELQWIYVATPSGVILNYPGSDGFRDDYDARTRPWYQTKDPRGPVWGRVYGDATGSGTLLPCNRALYDADGSLLGVLGIDFRLSDIEDVMPLPEVRGYEQAWLTNERGEIVGQTAEEETGKSNHREDFDELRLKPFPVEEVRASIKSQGASGQVLVKKTRYIYSALPSLGWTYIVSAKAD